jgi:DNA-binding NarL/FixJ family response regulator
MQSTPGKPRIILTDDHTLVAAAFAKLLQPEFKIAGSLPNGRSLLEHAPKLKPDVVILDLEMPLLNGIDAGERLKELLPDVKIVVLTVCEDPEVASNVLRRWASAFVLKKSASAELIKAIREVLLGRSYVASCLTQRLIGKFIQDPATTPTKSLTPRQREVLQLLAEGGTLKGVASELNLAPRTVAYHKYRMMREFGLKTNSDLILFAIKERVISGPEKSTAW